MTDLEQRYLELFSAWLSSLASDLTLWSALLANSELGSEERRVVAGALNCFLEYTDLIPDGLEDLGYLDSAIVLRAAATTLVEARALDASGTLERMAEEATQLHEFLGADYERLEKLVAGLTEGSVRGRSANEIATDEALQRAVANEITAWVSGYQAPPFRRDEKTLLKLKAFLTTKLPD